MTIELTIERVAAPRGAPFAAVLLVADDASLRALDFAACEDRMHRLLKRRFGAYRLTERRGRQGCAMAAYFAGDLTAIESIAVTTGGTEFQAAAWHALRAIPHGRTATYAEQARRIGRPQAVRAVGAANGQNPLAIVLPCHRVLGSNGALTGYAGGLAAKRWLLDHEIAHAR